MFLVVLGFPTVLGLLLQSVRKESNVPHIPGYPINNLQSFQKAINEPRQVAGLYFYQVLDPLAEIAYGISLDFRGRPQLYRDLGQPPIAPVLAKLRSESGTQVNILSQEQRNEIFAPIFGTSDSDSFPRLRDDLLRAAKAFAERSADTGVDMLREVVRASHLPFKEYLVGLHGDSVRFSNEVLFEFTEKICYPILRNPAIAAVFGIAKLAAERYPYATDAAEEILVEAISIQLGKLNGGFSGITRERISNLRRIAVRGAEAIATVIDFDESHHEQSHADIDLLISKCYSWYAALATIKTQPGVISAPAVEPNWAVVTGPSMGRSSPTVWRPRSRTSAGSLPSS